MWCDGTVSWSVDDDLNLRCVKLKTDLSRLDNCRTARLAYMYVLVFGLHEQN